MKKRYGFISNSSSSSFVIAVSDDYGYKSDEDLLAVIREVDEDGDYDGVPIEKIKKQIDDTVKEALSEYGFFVDNSAVFEEAILKMPGITTIASIETGPDGGCIVGKKKADVLKMFGIEVDEDAQRQAAIEADCRMHSCDAQAEAKKD